MDRQMLTKDLYTLRAAFDDYQREAAPELVARLAPGAPIVHISEIDQIDGQVKVRIRGDQSQQWHSVWAFYKRIDDGTGEEA